jgi:anti-sigma B factor antagonist
MADHKHLRVAENGDVAVIQFRDRWVKDFDQIEELGQELYQLVEGEAAPKLVLDFSDIEFLSSSALGKFISLHGKLRSHGGSMKLCALQPQILDVFLICRLDRLFDIKKDLPEAMAAF